jgi:hypothetical protein
VSSLNELFSLEGRVTVATGGPLGAVKYGKTTEAILSQWSGNADLDAEKQIRFYSTLVSGDEDKSPYQLRFS